MNHYCRLRFLVYSRSPLRLGELRRWNAYEIVRIPRADSGSTLGRPRIHRNGTNGNPGDLPICLIKSICTSMKHGMNHIRTIILSITISIRDTYVVNHFLAVNISVSRKRSDVSLFRHTSLLFPRAFTVGHILDRLGAASLHSTGIIAKPQGHFFLFSPLPCQVRSCVAWFRTSTCVIMRESTSKYSRAHVVEIHVCQPWMLRVSEPLISSCNIQPVLKQTGTCQFARSESGSE